jgi:hypothetical protein
MAHMVETMAWSGEVPWHGLGKKVLPDLTPEQMLYEAGLDWTVEKIPAFAEVNGKKVAVGKSALVRSSDNKILDVVGDDWCETQNAEAFGFFADFVSEGNMEMHTAGSLRGGQMVWALAKVKDESFELFGKDRVGMSRLNCLVRIVLILICCSLTLICMVRALMFGSLRFEWFVTTL